GGPAPKRGTFEGKNRDVGYVARRNALIQAVTLADVKKVAKRLYDPARLTVVIGGSPADARAPQYPVPLPPGNPPPPPQPPAGAAAAQASDAASQGVMPAPRPANKPLAGPLTTPKTAKK